MGHEILSKICTDCGVAKAVANFSKGKSASNPYRAACKNCARLALNKWRANNPEKVKQGLATYRAGHKEQARITGKKWAEANQDRVKSNRAAYYALNKNKIRSSNDLWTKANPEKAKAYGVAWRQRNKDQVRESRASYRGKNLKAYRIYRQNRRLAQSGGRLSPDISETLFSLQKGKCACCKRPLGADYHLDHIMPLALGGVNADGNMQLLRKRCNLQKNAKHPVDFMQSRGFLL